MNIKKTLEHLGSIGMSFVVTHDAPGGGRSIQLDATEAAEYAADPAKFLAKHYEVTISEYLEWRESSFSVKCSAKTAKGRRCKATIPGGTFVQDPKVWAEMQGGYCAIHGGSA